MANSHSSFLFFLLSFVLFLCDCPKKVEAAYRFKEKPANLHPQKHDFAISSLIPGKVCSAPTEGPKTISRLQVAYKYGPCSPMKRGNTTTPTLHQILLRDETRVKSIHSKISNQHSLVSDPAVELPANSGESLETGDFIVTVGFGTPKQDFRLVFDTGSDLTWIQCLPCSGQCYTQKDPYFNPSLSSTYSNIPCTSMACSQLESATGNAPSCSGNCIYQISYGDNSYSQGNLATDTLTLSSSDIFPKFKFGCGENNNGLFGYADGLLGLGRNQISTVSQTSHKYGKLFSYCLPSTSSFTGYLSFGKKAVASSGVQYTPLLTDSSGPSFYFLDLIGISVGGKRLSIPTSVFKISGTIIDSGTVISRLQPKAYSIFRLAFRRAMARYPAAPAYSILDTCFNLEGISTVTVPTIVLHFGGGTDLNVDQSGILIVANLTQYCLAFAGNDAATDLAIIGNMQQQTMEVVYDVEGGKLGFGPKGCS
ncbi:aspartyl protease family protein At5g10770-like [Macadamia integrifolia]|uniref:aspartyl protease family protein At5g10770-like n=1 Tax=Macadamia integrifolia TaxID=60698 RepID=UPI001C533CC6|nr:aspartyl protease family protein At5g10770-like [Macadamia integrifolia]